jgi:group II intron reverse transcriptase/maturase
VVDVDLSKFFDRVNHDILMDRLRRRIDDAGVIRLIRAYLNSGIMDDGIVQSRDEGTPQGGPLSPLLANVMLDEVDKELERRGHCFARYADDANVYVRSVRAVERVMAVLRRCYAKLHLLINEEKSAVASVFGRKFLGFSPWVGRGGEVKLRVAKKPLLAFKQRIRELTRRLGGRSMTDVVDRLRSYLLGWKGYFRYAQTPESCKSWTNGCVIVSGLSCSKVGGIAMSSIGNCCSLARQPESRGWLHPSDSAGGGIVTGTLSMY